VRVVNRDDDGHTVTSDDGTSFDLRLLNFEKGRSGSQSRKPPSYHNLPVERLCSPQAGSSTLGPMSKSRRIPNLADAAEATAHLRLVIDREHLSARTVLVVCCDANAEPIHHWHVLGCIANPTPSECSAVLDDLVGRAEEGPPVTGLALALTRPGGEEIQPYDRTWFRAYHRICHHRGLTPYGVYTVTRSGARPVHIDDAA
jgi:hypothetical protein